MEVATHLDPRGPVGSDGEGFAAFGRVTRGMDVVKKIPASAAEAQTLKPPVKIMKMTRRP